MPSVAPTAIGSAFGSSRAACLAALGTPVALVHAVRVPVTGVALSGVGDAPMCAVKVGTIAWTRL